jgi:hypothetical protein
MRLNADEKAGQYFKNSMRVWKFSFSTPFGGVCRCMQQCRFGREGSTSLFKPGAHFKSSVILQIGYVFHKKST